MRNSDTAKVMLDSSRLERGISSLVTSNGEDDLAAALGDLYFITEKLHRYIIGFSSLRPMTEQMMAKFDYIAELIQKVEELED